MSAPTSESAPAEVPVAAAPAAPVEEGPKVYVGNLAFSATEAEVREFMSTAGGEITSVELPLKFGKRPGGFAFVSYKSEEDAKKAAEQLNGQSLGDRVLRLEFARSKEESAERRKAAREKRESAKAEKAEKATKAAPAAGAEGVEASDKPKKTKRRERRRQPDEGDDTLVEKEDGEVSPKAKARKPKTRKPREARIDGGAEEEAAPVAEKKPKEKKERKPRLELTGDPSPNTIFVANLPFSVDDAALAAIFTNLSIKVKSAKVIRGRRAPAGRRPFYASKGFGFVEVEDASQQKEAVEKVEGSLIGDRAITAKIANEMKPIEVEQTAEAAA